MTLLRALGSDLNINAFALNWRHADGTLNTDVEEANYLMNRVVSRLSVDSPDDKPTKIPFYLTSTEFSKEDYGRCVTTFKKRLGLEQDSAESLMVLRNVVMSPLASLSTGGDFINMLGETFREVIEEEVKICQTRNEDTADHHSFLTHGTDHLFLSYRSMFHIAKHRHQIILAAQFDAGGWEVCRDVKGNTEEEILLKTAHKIDLQALLKEVDSRGNGSFLGNLTTSSNGVVSHGLKVHITKMVKNRPLRSAHQDEHYPSGFMPFYLYGTPREIHIEHILTHAPNITLSAGNVSLVLDKDTGTPIEPNAESHTASHASGGQHQYRNQIRFPFNPRRSTTWIENDNYYYDLGSSSGSGSDSSLTSLSTVLGSGAILTIQGIHEAAMQPFGEKNGDLPPPDKFFFSTGRTFNVKVWKDPRGAGESALGLVSQVLKEQKTIATGTLTLGDEVVVDVEKLNRDPWKEDEDGRVARWIERFGRIRREIEAEDGHHGV